MPNLRIRDAGKEYTYQVSGDAATLGRGDTNDIDIADAKASKDHCRIERVGQRWKLVDLESKNGTKVNGAFKNKAWLGHGDLVQIGMAEMKFGLEGTARAPAAAAGTAAAGRRPTRDAAAEEGEEEEVPRQRYKKNNLVLIVSASSAGLLLLILLSIMSGGGSNNALVLKEGNRKADDGDWTGAIQYMETYGEPEHDDYVMVERRLKALREGLAMHEKVVRENEANRIESKLNLLIKSYNIGHVMESGPDKILPLIRQLKQKYAGTDAAERVRKEYPAWWAGRVPQPASQLIESGGKFDKDWTDAVERSQSFCKEWLFREAEEAVREFVANRDAVLGAGELSKYEQARDDELSTIASRAESVYRGQVQIAEQLLKNKRYDDAIAVYQKVVEKFGIDMWVRKAQAEIAKIQKMKPGG